MDKTITLDALQIRLLQKFVDADSQMNSARDAYKKAEHEGKEPDISTAFRAFRDSFNARDHAASVFAMCVASELKL